ncbi:MAG: hypothetical protein HYT28_01025 [Parcubacteria group bacterium]|nr:hypothetical protein [Parcubacteria group bacterium]
MPQYTKEQFEEKFNALPKDIQEAIVASDTENTIRGIGQKYHLHIDQIGELMEATDFVMLGVSPPKEYIRDLYQRFESEDKEKVRQIAHDVNEQVFQKIKESLKQIHNVENETQNMKHETPMTAEPPRTTESKDEIVEKIEFPEKEEKDIVKEKLQAMNVMPKAESEYEMKPDGGNKKKWSADPYREPI